MSLRRRALFLAGLFVAVSCSDAGNPLEPGPTPRPRPVDALQVLQCAVNIPTATMQCALPQPNAGGALAAGQMITGGQNKYVTLSASNFASTASSLEFNVTVKSLMRQALGTENGETLHANGVRVWFADDPVAQPTGTVSVDSASGVGTLLTAPTPYFQYDTILRTNQTSKPKRWRFDFSGGATNIQFKVYVVAQVQYPNGWVDVTPPLDTLAPGATVDLDGIAYDARADSAPAVSQTLTWSSSDGAVATVDAGTGVVSAVAAGTATITASNGTQTGSATIVVNTRPAFVVDSILAISNVTIPEPAPGLLEGASDGDGHTPSVVPDTVTTARGGTAWLNADGSLQYLSKAGFAGRDTIPFQLTDGVSRRPAYAVVDVAASSYWYVRPGGTGDGRDRFPFGTLAQAQDSAAAGDTILVLANGVQQVDGPVTLKADQAILGQGIPTSLTREVNGQTVTILAAGAAPGLTNTAAGATVTLGTGNVIRGVGITAAAGAAISGSGFGALFVREVDVNPAGPALLLATGAVDAVFGTLSSTGSATTGVSLTGVTGTLTATAGAIGNATGTAFHVSGGSADVSYAGSISNSAGPAVSISGRTGGTLTLSGTITDTGAGISVTGNTGGTIEFTGSSKSISTGTGAGVSLATNTGATISFAGGGLAVSTTSGAGFTATGGGTVSVTGAGNSIATTSGTALDLNGVSTGTGGASFVSVSANGAASGITLANLTGAGVQVTGTGTTAGSGGTIQNTTGHAVSLASLAGADSVRLQYINVSGGAGGNAGVFGSAFGTLRVAGLSVGTTGGPALSLSTGTLNGGFSSLSSVNSANNGVILTSVDGSFTAAAGTISNAGSTGFAVAGGGVSATYQGGISQGANNAPLVAVSGSHTGTLTFDTGTLSASTGTGLSFNAADGAYAFNGTTTLNGGDAGIDITNGSTGTFTFGTGTSVTSPTGSAFTVYGSSPTVAYSGNLTKGNAGLLVEIGEQPGGSVTFQTGTLAATAGDGISFSNADGASNFTGTTTLNGGNAGVDVVSGSSGAIAFGAGTGITNASGVGLHVNNGAASANVSYAGTLSSSGTGIPAQVEGVSGGTVTVSGNVTSTGQGILVQNNTGGTIAFDGTSKSLSTGANAAVTASTNPGATVRFAGGGLAITTTAGAGFTASGGGTVSVTGAGNTIASSTGTALSLASVSTGASGVNLASVSANGGAGGIVLNTLTGVGVQVNGGIIQNTTGPAVLLTGLAGLTSQVELSGMTLSRSAGTGAVVSGTTFGTLALGASSVSATGGPTALSLTTGSLSGTISSIAASGVTAGTHAVSLTGVGGTYTVSGGTVNGTSSGDALRVSGGNAVATWNNTLAATLAGGRSVNIGSTTGGSHTFANTVTAGNASAGVSITGNAGSVTMPGLSLGTSVARFSATPLTLQMGSGNVSLGAVSIFTTGGSATALGMTSAAGSGTLSVASGTIDVAGSAAVNVAPSSGTQPLSISLTTVNANGGTSGVILNGTSGSFTVTGTGSTAGSGGTIQNTSGNAISLSSASNVQISLMSLQPDGSGWMGTNLSGTNSLSRSTVDYLGTAPGGAYAFRVANTNTNATITLDGTTFQNKMDGTTSVSISAMGNSVITFNAIDSNTGDAFPSRYQNLFGSGIVVGSGDDVGSTATVTANVSNTSFLNAPSNGLTNLELGVTQNATLVPNIANNVFDKVALPLATVGVINLNATVMGRVGSNTTSGVISGNSITNIRSGAGPTFAYDPAGTNGYVGMRVAIDNDAGGVNHKLQILNNTITNVARQGLLVSARGAANNVNVLVQGNTIGTAAAPVGTASARRGVEIEAQTTATLKLQVANNPSIVGGTSASNSALHIRAGVNSGATSAVQATVTGNTIANPNAGTNDGRFRAETVFGNNGTMCLDLRDNVLESAAKEFQTNNNGGTYGRNASGNTGTITTVGVVGAVASCTLPSF
ncbi:MAG: Ig-like domain-containing protein [Gemmatimonadetes bacterium]|nr:Ig-like domain-containing protein [Gemmatimonadota bacterium]